MVWLDSPEIFQPNSNYQSYFPILNFYLFAFNTNFQWMYVLNIVKTFSS